jgi:hypothetical protein
MSAAKSGWERHPVVAAIEDLALDIRQRLDAIAREDLRRQQARDAARIFHNQRDSDNG